MGVILNIQRFSVQDGPGIRTTVFLKGCTLHCLWCSNPESIKDELELAFEASNCIQCLACINTCQVNAIKKTKDAVEVDFTTCINCGECVEFCPTNCVQMHGIETEVEQIIEQLCKDAKYYEKSKGGVTFSGGEPLKQPDFLLKLLIACKEKGIHTCVQTSGYANQKIFERIIPFTDMFLYDYKITDTLEHEKYTNNGNEVILKNLEFLNKENVPIRLRCIVVPEINDNNQHFQGIAEISNKYENIEGVDLIPYHTFGRSKYVGMGKELKLKQESVGHDQALEWLGQMKSLNTKNVQLVS